MQPQETFSTPRRALDVEDYIDILRRHKGWIFGPFLLALVATTVGVYLWPDTYLSTATVKVTPQQLPESLLPSVVNQQMTARIDSMSQTVLSRSQLTNLIQTHGLYPRERSRMPLEDVVESMRKKINISGVSQINQPGRAIPAFQISFAYENRHLAQKVVQELMSRFIEQNIRERSTSSHATTTFFRDQWEAAKRELDDLENRLAQFRMANQGRLPDQLDSNLRQMTAFQTQIQVLGSTISRANQDKLLLEAQIKIYREQLEKLTREPESSGIPAPRNDRLAEADREVQFWEDRLLAMRQTFKDSHPDVTRANSLLAGARKKRDDLLKQIEEGKKSESPAKRVVSPQVAREIRDYDATIKRGLSQVEAKDIEIDQAKKEIDRLNGQIKAIQVRIEAAPLGEKQYMELVRDRDLAKSKYQDLDLKMNKSMMSQEMEGRRQGEQLEQLDPASLPTSPTEPKRELAISMGAAMGLLIGIVLAGAREMKDTSLKNLKDVRAYTKLAILGSVPLLENDFVVRRRRRLAWLGWTTACLAGVVIMAGSIVYYYVTKT